MDMEAGDLFSKFLGHHVDRDFGPAVQHVPQTVEPTLRQQEGSRAIARLDRATDHLLAFGDEQPMLGFEVPPERGVAQPDVVGQPLVGRVADRDQAASRLDRPGRATRRNRSMIRSRVWTARRGSPPASTPTSSPSSSAVAGVQAVAAAA